MLVSIMLYAFCGVLAGPNDLPRFWIFVYRVSLLLLPRSDKKCMPDTTQVNPFTYVVSTFLSATLGQAPAHCAPTEFQTFAAPSNQTCAQYMREYLATAGGYLSDAQATGECNYCRMDSTSQYLESVHADWSTRWRDFGLLWVYVAFNVGAAVGLYWMFRVPKGKKRA
jgi:ATP-binding cassette subfamily G (WHITE) protein 2 (PDR)